MRRYGQIAADGIEVKKKNLQEPLNTPQPIDVLFKVIDAGVWYASEENTLFYPARVLQIAFHTVRYSGIYTCACKDWHRKPSADKMWDTLRYF